MKVSRLILCVLVLLAFSFKAHPAPAAQAPDNWVARIVSIEGSAHGKKSGDSKWYPAKLEDKFYPGDMLRVLDKSRAALVLRNESNVRLDENTTITFKGLEEGRTVFVDILEGATHFFNRVTRTLKFSTPYVNGIIQGTEFLVKVDKDHTLISIFEGRVSAENERGSVIVTGGQSVIARAGQPPVLTTVVRPRDAVQWALFYPRVTDFRPDDFAGTGWQNSVRKSVEFYRSGNISAAIDALKGLPDEQVTDTRYLLYRATLGLSVGRVDDAAKYLDRALKADPNNAGAHALQSIIAVVQNRKDDALNLATRATTADPQSSAAWIALSYARQARFDIKRATAATQEAVKISPSDALARTRLAELWLSQGYLDRALDEAKRAVSINSGLARAQTVLGFAYLSQIKIGEAKAAFEKSIALDSSDPLSRLGLGLAKIRKGDLEAGRQEIEIAASLDVNNSLIRSYLGKAYYEEKRERLSSNQLAIAKQLDPMDPTPWFYEAVLKQSINRPVEALNDIQKSIELNNNRAVYRSQLLMDQDLAARSASLGQIFNNLGFQPLALVEGWKSVNTDPNNFSAHRLLADTYAAVPRHGIARVSELLQAQLLQPININPVQPQLAESNLRAFEGAGPTMPAYNEYNPLFNRNRVALQASGLWGDKGTYGDEVTLNGVYDNVSASLGQMYYKTKGFRDNNDLKQEIYNAFFQSSITYQTSVQAEARYTDFHSGDLNLRFDPNVYSGDYRENNQARSFRVGLNHAFSPNLNVIFSGIYRHDYPGAEWPIGGYFQTAKSDGYIGEAQVRFRSDIVNVIAGAGYTEVLFDSHDKFVIPFLGTFESDSESNKYHTNGYIYTITQYPRNVAWTLGVSYDRYNTIVEKDEKMNPKFGVMFTPWEGTTFRAAAFHMLKRNLLTDQTIEPTQVAGFNQFFDESRIDGTEFWRYGFGLDQKIFKNLFGGVEYSWRDIKTPYLYGMANEIREADWDEKLFRAYLNWAPHPFLALSAEYQHERFDRGLDNPGIELLTKLITQRLPMAVNFFHPSGIFAQFKGTYVWQEGDFLDSTLYPWITSHIQGRDSFWVFDSFLGYRLPNRWGALTVGVKNMFNQGFNFQDTDPTNPTITPERFFYGRLTLNF